MPRPGETVRTACPYCGVGCGVAATLGAGRSVTIRGDADHPANAGRLCSKGTHLGETVTLDGRLLYPQIAGRQAGWDEALARVADGFRDAIAKYGPDSVALYVSGQLLTEDYYVANKLAKGFLGTGNIDTNSRLCMASAVAAHNRAFGEDVVPANYEDLELADLIVLVGSNAAWCHPVLFQRIAAAREAHGAKIIVIDPRRTETCAIADLHLPLRPGSDVALFNGLLGWLKSSRALDLNYLSAHVDMPDGFWDGVDDDVAHVAALCGLDPADVETFYRLFAETPRTVTAFSMGVNQSSRGVDKANAIINCHLVTGRVGKPGASPFSITGQPNAMGGREVGGLSNQLAAHMGFDEDSVDCVRRFWQAPHMVTKPGLKAVDLFDAVREGKIKALWIMGTNPVVSLPDAQRVQAALALCPFVVVSDCVAGTDTMAYADVALPAAAWGEKSGTVTNSERRITRQRPVFDLPGEVRPDWWIIAAAARRMGFGAGFNYAGPADIFREHAELSAFENNGRRLFDIGAMEKISDAAFDDLQPFQWPARKKGQGDAARCYGDGRFSTANGKARLVATPFEPPVGKTSRDFPLSLNTGRIRDQWHTMTRTGLSPRLALHRREPNLDIHPADAENYGLTDGGLAFVETEYGRDLFRVSVTENQRRGDIFVPIHWNGQTSSAGRAGLLVNPVADAISGEPEFKHTPAAVRAYAPAWQGFLLTRFDPDLSNLAYWTRAALADAALYEFAADGENLSFVESLLPHGAGLARAEAGDARGGWARYAVMRQGRVIAAMFLSKSGCLPARDWVVAQFSGSGDLAPAALLAGRPAQGGADPGAQICACFNVGANTILTAIRERSLVNVADVGAALQAGTNCGSCRPAIAGLLEQERSAIQLCPAVNQEAELAE